MDADNKNIQDQAVRNEKELYSILQLKSNLDMKDGEYH